MKKCLHICFLVFLSLGLSSCAKKDDSKSEKSTPVEKPANNPSPSSAAKENDPASTTPSWSKDTPAAPESSTPSTPGASVKPDAPTPSPAPGPAPANPAPAKPEQKQITLKTVPLIMSISGESLQMNSIKFKDDSEPSIVAPFSFDIRYRSAMRFTVGPFLLANCEKTDSVIELELVNGDNRKSVADNQSFTIEPGSYQLLVRIPNQGRCRQVDVAVAAVNKVEPVFETISVSGLNGEKSEVELGQKSIVCESLPSEATVGPSWMGLGGIFKMTIYTMTQDPDYPKNRHSSVVIENSIGSRVFSTSGSFDLKPMTFQFAELSTDRSEKLTNATAIVSLPGLLPSEPAKADHTLSMSVNGKPVFQSKLKCSLMDRKN